MTKKKIIEVTIYILKRKYTQEKLKYGGEVFSYLAYILLCAKINVRSCYKNKKYIVFYFVSIWEFFFSLCSIQGIVFIFWMLYDKYPADHNHRPRQSKWMG